MSNTDTISKNPTHGFQGCWELNQQASPGFYKATPEQAFKQAAEELNDEFDFGPAAIRRILDSTIGRHLCDAMSFGRTPVMILAAWMNRPQFQANLFAITDATDKEFYNQA